MRGALFDVESRLRACNTIISTHPRKEGGRTHLQLAHETKDPVAQAHTDLQPRQQQTEAVYVHLAPALSGPTPPKAAAKPLLLPAATRTATTARRREGRPVDPKGFPSTKATLKATLKASLVDLDGQSSFVWLWRRL